MVKIRKRLYRAPCSKCPSGMGVSEIKKLLLSSLF